MKKMPLNQVKWVRAILFAVGLLMLCLGVHLRLLPLTLLGLVPLLGGVLFGFLFYRCPHCGKFLGRADGGYCPFCGEKLDT
ncbi:MAG: hypothetical protein Q4F17_09410 [Eubacteriales bacterium]|nr:hypothetical protein [Eubacteriales bacterium]